MLYEKLGLKGVGSMNDLLTMAQPHINYEEMFLAEDVETNKELGKPMNGRFRDKNTP